MLINWTLRRKIPDASSTQSDNARLLGVGLGLGGPVGQLKLPHPAEVVEGLRVDDLRQVLHDEAETLLLQLGGETPHLLRPLDLGEAAHQLLAAAQRGHGVAHGLNGRQLSAKSLFYGVRA